MNYTCAGYFEGRTYRYTVKTNHWLPKLTPWHEDAITLFNTVYCLTDCPSDLHAHEFRHIVQFHDYGWLPMLAYYLRDMVVSGYRNNWAEREARAYSLNNGHLFTDLT